MSHIRETADKALKMLRTLPRVQIGNIRPNPNSKQNVSKLYKIIKKIRQLNGVQLITE